MKAHTKRLLLAGGVLGATLLVGSAFLGSEPKKKKKRRSSTGQHPADARVWPLPDWPPNSVQHWQSGARSFGAVREERGDIEEHIHGGIDLGPPRAEGEPLGRAYGSRVVSPVAGRVEVVGGGWDGPEAKRIEIVSPIYGRIVLGAVQKKAAVKEGQWVEAGQLVGWLGRYPGGSSMLHLEQHEGARTKWLLGKKPAGIIDPRASVLQPWMA